MQAFERIRMDRVNQFHALDFDIKAFILKFLLHYHISEMKFYGRYLDISTLDEDSFVCYADSC